MRMRIILLLLLMFLLPDTALAADKSESIAILQEGAGWGAAFDEQLETIGTAFVVIAKVVVLVMTATAGRFRHRGR